MLKSKVPAKAASAKSNAKELILKALSKANAKPQRVPAKAKGMKGYQQLFPVSDSGLSKTQVVQIIAPSITTAVVQNAIERASKLSQKFFKGDNLQNVLIRVSKTGNMNISINGKVPIAAKEGAKLPAVADYDPFSPEEMAARQQLSERLKAGRTEASDKALVKIHKEFERF